MQRRFGFVPIGEAAGPVKSAIFGYNASRLFNLELHAGGGWRGNARYARKRACENAGPRRRTLAYGYISKRPRA
jgi:uncharacterized protein